jgi:hypothetical protein
MLSLVFRRRHLPVQGFPRGELVTAIRNVAAGERVVSPEISHILAIRSTRPRLSSRQLEVLSYVTDEAVLGVGAAADEKPRAPKRHEVGSRMGTVLRLMHTIKIIEAAKVVALSREIQDQCNMMPRVRIVRGWLAHPIVADFLII